ncbi:MAG: outer membrane beta-barrel protein [Tunicatimonas sp.]|uniref:outer membrane beta-barrel protein n=1 Tax=Tunicatimonas sp. TaxID=1940096 RepID=UPI003C76C31E
MLHYKKFLGGLALSLLIATTSAQAQDTTTTPEGAQPDLPGMLLIDFGFNFLNNAPDDLETRIWGSRGFNVYYLYPIPIGESKFSLHTGLGLGFVNYSFDGRVTLSDEQDSTQFVPLDATTYPNLRKTQLTTHYLDIPLEVRFFAKENYRGFTAAIGGRVGRLINSFTKIKYEDGGTNEEDKFKRRYNLNPWRYGAYAKVGFRGITLTGQYMFSDLFTSGEGPEVNNYKIGITIGLF